MILTKIRPVVYAPDKPHIMDMDLECFSDPWDELDWEQVCTLSPRNTSKVFVSTCMGVPSGFIVWREGINDGCIKRLAVRSILQKHGIGTLLLEAVETSIRKAQGRQLFIEVPESLCYLDDRKLVQWLKNRGYAGTFVKHGAGFYQGDVEDVIVFGKDIMEG